ncbi:TetR family transcriptional regulator [Sinobacterium caligoides]|uniref:TetR family transcriptional regulator n=1 Tax=Sinobacterium caligoides TaxID=933926 RepID=A0A3N2DP70_9GAMM|nr:TetR/AcrR family transcriptional regulator [Sinobacterium caligoides]ROS01125.1 TetR family transcriptional regulator [Sinobacterium caligoides]
MKRQKPNLSRQKIVDAALSMAAEATVDDISIHRLAKQLAVTPMAIYRHFANKADLQAEMLDQFIIQADVMPEQYDDWQHWLHQLAEAMYRALCEQPSWIPLFGRVHFKAGALTVMDRSVGMLKTAGFDDASAVAGFYGLIHCLIGAATQYSFFHREGGEAFSMLTLQKDAAVAQHYPHLAALNKTAAPASQLDLLASSLTPYLRGLSLTLTAQTSADLG